MHFGDLYLQINCITYRATSKTINSKGGQAVKITVLKPMFVIVQWCTVYREFFASGNFGENDAIKVC